MNTLTHALYAEDHTEPDHNITYCAMDFCEAVNLGRRAGLTHADLRWIRLAVQYGQQALDEESQ